MDFNAAIARRMITNSHLRTAQGWAEFRDLGGALCMTSDAPIPELNCLGDFSSDEHRVEGLLDVGFGLLRAFDCAAAAETTPLDRPSDVERRMAQRGLVRRHSRTWMVLGERPNPIRTNPAVEIQVAAPDDAATFAAVHGGSERWVKKLSRSSTLTAMHDGGNTFYLAHLERQPVGTAHLLIDGTIAGIYAVGTLRAYRKRGVCTTLMARAIADARAAGCDVVCLSTDTGGYAEQLYARMGFEPMFQSGMWVMPERPFEPPPSKRLHRRRARA